jgi:hypothetical protein
MDDKAYHMVSRTLWYARPQGQYFHKVQVKIMGGMNGLAHPVVCHTTGSVLPQGAGKSWRHEWSDSPYGMSHRMVSTRYR